MAKVVVCGRGSEYGPIILSWSLPMPPGVTECAGKLADDDLALAFPFEESSLGAACGPPGRGHRGVALLTKRSPADGEAQWRAGRDLPLERRACRSSLSVRSRCGVASL
ncbi:hypothetical protein NDU88_005186 [Pleurodeles waltl]|uniref:Uncharacterized protein n=1 Tax=Pleurodeles waltl TaxID=8319 RepID=A0AAV7WU11_PLEWA|nr:hypothetical protein NDU88_005186 [Pleurodeles waltl]